MKKIFVTVLCAVAISACATPPRFEYGAYEPTLYAFYKKPELRERYETALEKAIKRGETQNRLAPGLHAALGYLRLQDGDSATAIQHFQQEMIAFPEAAYFMERVISRITGNPPADSGLGEESIAVDKPEVTTEQNSETVVG